MKIGNKRFAEGRRNVRVTHRAVTATLSAVVAGMLLVPAASACALGDQPDPLVMVQLSPDAQNPLASATLSSLARDQSSASSATRASIVGMWNFQLISQGNTTRNPAIADFPPGSSRSAIPTLADRLGGYQRRRVSGRLSG